MTKETAMNINGKQYIEISDEHVTRISKEELENRKARCEQLLRLFSK